MTKIRPVCVLVFLLPFQAIAGEYERGIEAFNKKDYALAITCLNAHLRENPKDAAAFNVRGLAYSWSEKYDKAVVDFSESIRLDPKHAKVYFNRAGAYTDIGKNDNAIEDYSEAIRLNPQYAGAFNNRGLIFHRAGKFEKAIADFAEAIRLDSKDPFPYYNRGLSEFLSEQYDKAVADLSEAIRLDPEMGGPINSLGWLLATCPKDGIRDGKRAVELAKKACELSGWKNPGDLEVLAAAHAECGNFKEAVKWQKQVIEIGKYSKQAMEQARQRLKLYEDSKPFRGK